MSDVKLTAPLVKVRREGHEDLEIQTDNRDLVLWERTRVRQRPPWPSYADAPFVWLTFLSWSAARRRGDIEPGHKYEAWEAEVIDVANVGADDDEDEELGRPTEPGHDPG